MTFAEIMLGHNQFQIVGPSVLVTWINALVRSTASPETKHVVYQKKLTEYYVVCAVTGERIPLSDLKYWDVEKQKPYRDAEAGLKLYTTTCSA